LKKPTDAATKDALSAAAHAVVADLDTITEDLQFLPKAVEDQQVDLAKQIVATIKAKNIKKVDPSHLLKISRHLAGLLTDMVSKTGDELHNNPSSDLSDRAKAALELEKLLSSLESDASRSNSTSSNASQQSIDSLLSSLNLKTEAVGAGAETHLSKQISSVAKQIKTSGSIEGTALHTISQSLASDLQKFADADSGNSRSELIVLGRSISLNIVKLADELKRLASQCTDPQMQEKLLRNSQVLRNYATQLKIMASVRAASPKTSQDSASDQLVMLTQNLAAVLSDSSKSVSIMKQTKKGVV